MVPSAPPRPGSGCGAPGAGEADLPGDSVECAEDELLSALRCFRQPVRTNRYGEVIRPTAGPPTTLRMNPRVLFSLAPDRSCTGEAPSSGLF